MFLLSCPFEIHECVQPSGRNHKSAAHMPAGKQVIKTVRNVQFRVLAPVQL